MRIKSFSKTLSDYISLPKNKRNTVSKPLVVCATPLALVAIGAEPLLMTMNANDVDKCLASSSANKNKNSHELTFKELKQLPELLADPTFVFANTKNPNYLTIVSDKLDSLGRPFVIAVEMNFKQDWKNTVHRIATMYARNHALENHIAANGVEVQGYIPRMIAEGNLIAINIEKATNLLRPAGLQLPEGKIFVTYDNIIAHPENSVNTQNQAN
jgi:hypothetical protein